MALSLFFMCGLMTLAFNPGTRTEFWAKLQIKGDAEKSGVRNEIRISRVGRVSALSTLWGVPADALSHDDSKAKQRKTTGQNVTFSQNL